MLNDLITLCVYVGNEEKHLKLKLFGANAHHIINCVNLVSTFFTFLENLTSLQELRFMNFDDSLDFRFLLGNFNRELILVESSAFGVLHLILSDKFMLNTSKVFLHAVDQDVTVIFHENFLKASAPFELKADGFLTSALLYGELLNFEVIKTGKTVKVLVDVDEFERVFVANGEVVNEDGAGEDGGKFTEAGVVVPT